MQYNPQPKLRQFETPTPIENTEGEAEDYGQ